MTARYVLDKIQQAYDEKAAFLDLGKCGLTEIPGEIEMLAPFLRQLNLGPYYNLWDKQKNSINKGAFNRFTGVDNGFEHLSSCKLLDTLYVNNVALNTESIKPFGAFHQLRMLEVYGNKLSDNDAVRIGELVNLSFLDIGSNKITWRGAQAISRLVNLSSLYINYNQLDQEGAEAIGRLHHLTTLAIAGNQLSDEGLKELGVLDRLISLDIRYNYLRGNGLVAIGWLRNLAVLDLTGNTVGVKGMRAIGRLTNLTSLDLSGTDLTDNAVKAISHLNHLTTLHIGGNELTDESAEMVSRLGELTSLNIGRNRLTSKGITAIGRLNNLTHLFVAGIPIKAPDAEVIGQLGKLNTLDVSNTQFTDKGAEAIACLDQLDTLYAGDNQLSATGAEAIGRLGRLTTLYVQNNQLTDEGAEAISRLANLSVLLITNNQLTDRGAEAISRLNRLTLLSISQNRFTGKGMEAISHLGNLSTLHITNAGLTDEGMEAIVRLNKLSFLSLSGNQVTAKGAAAIARLNNLEDLWIDNNQLGDEGAEALSRAKGLKQLTIGENQLTEKGIAALCRLRNLHLLYLSGNRVADKGAMALEQLHELRVLSISHNGLADEGARAISRLKHLEILWIDNNYVSDEGAQALSNLSNLESVHIDKNRITDKGVEALLACPRLDRISFSDNDTQAIPEEIIYSIDAMRAYFRSTERVNNTLVKMILIGNTTAGKSTLAKFLATGQYDPALESTHGIQLWKWVIKEHDYDLRVNIWDFGGQDYYHATHNIFLDNKALYLFLQVPREIHNRGADQQQYMPEGYWLGNIDSLTNGRSPIWYVQSKTDLYQPPYPDTALSVKYKVKDHFAVSVAKAAGSDGKDLDFQRFHTRLCQQLAGLVGGRLPVSWVAVRDELLPLWREKSLYFSEDQFQRRCYNALQKKPAVLKDLKQTWKGLLPYLKGCGEVVHFPENPELDDIIFLSAGKLTNGIYELLSKKVKDNNGVFTLHTLKQDDRKHAELYLKVLLAFGLVFEKPDQQGTYVVPQYLPENSRTTHYLEMMPVVYVIRFPEYMSRSLITRFLVTYARYLTDNDYWRYGAYLKMGEIRVLVRIDADKQKIYINSGVEGGKKRYEVWKELFFFFTGWQPGDSKTVQVPEGIELSLDGEHFAPMAKLVEAIDNGAHKTKSIQGVDIKFNDTLFQLLADPATISKKIFFSYAHEDREYLVALDKHFAGLKRSAKIETWSDQDILAGDDWHEKIQKALEGADIMLLLLSADLMASDYVWEKEIPIAREKGIRIVLVFLRPCHFEGTVFELEGIKGLPGDKEWIVNQPPHLRDDAYYRVVEGIQKVLDNK